MKICTKCKQEKELSEYYKKVNSKDGKSTICKKCSESRHEHKCLFCNKIFKSGRKNSKYCSEKCKNLHQCELIKGEDNPRYNSIKANCSYCNKELTIPKFRSKQRKVFCNDECKKLEYKSKRIKFNCDYCGKETSFSKHRYERCQYHYCSEVCGDKGKGKFHSKENSYLWNEDITEEEREEGRKTSEYRLFRKKAFEFYDYTCDITGTKGGDLVVHHLNGYSWFKEGRVDINNVVILTESIHKKFHSIYGFKNIKKEQYIEFKKSQQ